MNIPQRLEFIFLLALTMIGFIYLIVSTKLWQYHYFPLYFSLCLWYGYCLYMVWDFLKHRVRWMSYLVSLGMMLIMILPISLQKNYESSTSFFQSGFAVLAPWKRVRPVVRHFKKHLKPEDKVQPLDVVRGVAHAMLIQQVRIATPFVYDFHFYHHTNEPYIQSLRQRFLTSLKAATPKIIVDNQRCHWMGNFLKSKEKQFPELYEWIEENYTFVEQSQCYNFWHRKE